MRNNVFFKLVDLDDSIDALRDQADKCCTMLAKCHKCKILLGFDPQNGKYKYIHVSQWTGAVLCDQCYFDTTHGVT